MRASRTISEQFEFNFESQAEKPDPILAWRESRRRELEKLCHRQGLPLGHLAEVRLANGSVLRGTLKLTDHKLWTKSEREAVVLQIDETTFSFADVLSARRVERTDLFE